jgi:hypothetical protein
MEKSEICFEKSSLICVFLTFSGMNKFGFPQLVEALTADMLLAADRTRAGQPSWSTERKND